MVTCINKLEYVGYFVASLLATYLKYTVVNICPAQNRFGSCHLNQSKIKATYICTRSKGNSSHNRGRMDKTSINTADNTQATSPLARWSTPVETHSSTRAEIGSKD